MITKNIKTTYILLILLFLNLQCETVENRLEYFISERMKETEMVQKICEDFGNLNLKSNAQNYIEKLPILKEKLERSRTDILKNSIQNLKLDSDKVRSQDLDNLSSLLNLSESEKKRFSEREKLDWEEKYKNWNQDKKAIIEKIKSGKDITKDLEDLKKSMVDLVSLKDNLVYALKLSFTQALLVAIVHNANEAEKSLDKHTNKLGSIGIIAEAIGREIITEVMAQLVEILIPYIEKKELINPIDFTRESCRVYQKYETTPGVANRILKRSILRFLKEDNGNNSLIQIYSLNNINGLQNESELGTKTGLKKLEDKKKEIVRKISSSDNLLSSFSNPIPECKSNDCKSLSENIQKDSILPAIPSIHLSEKLILSYDKCLETKDKCEPDAGVKNKETLLTESIQSCLKEKNCDWDIVNEDVSWRIWHASPVLARMEDYIFLKARYSENSFRRADNESYLLAKMEELQGNIRVLRNDILQSMNASCAGQLEQQRIERVDWLKKLQKSGFAIETKSKVDLAANTICSLGEPIQIKKDKLNVSISAASICSFQPIEINLERLYGNCEFKSPEDDKLSQEAMNLLEILRTSLSQSSINLQVIGFTDDIDATYADCQKKIQTGLKDTAIQPSLRDCPKPCEGNLALSHLRALHFKNYLSSKEKLFNGQISFNAYGVSKLDAIGKSNKDMNRRILLKVFASNSKYGCY